MKCSICRAANKPYALFCLGCGEPLDPAAARTPTDNGEFRDRPTPATAAGAAGAVISLRLLFARRHYELLIGLALLAVVLVAGVCDAVRQETLTTAYRAGLRAEAERQWDEAAGGFARAEDHRDARARLENARTTIVKRNRLYEAGLAAAALSEWSRARLLFGQASAIQPDYEDVEQQLAAAREEELRVGLSGLFYLAAGGPGRAGLYRKAPLGTPDTYLAGTDAGSEVLVLSAGGDKVIYATGRGRDRRLYLGQFDGSLDRSPRIDVLSTRLDPYGTGAAARSGFWWLNGAMSKMYFIDYGSIEMRPVALVGNGWQVYSYDPPRERLVLGHRGFGDGKPGTQLLLTDALGGDARLVAATDATIRGAEISPDGRWLLYQQEQVGALASYRDPGAGPGAFSTYWRRGGQSDLTYSLMLAGLDAGQETEASDNRTPPRPRMLDFLVLPADALGGRIIARFAPNRENTYVVADRLDSLGRRVTIYETESGLQTTLWPEPAPGTASRRLVFSPPGNSLLLQGQLSGGINLRIQPLDTREQQQRIALSLGRQDLVRPLMSGDEDYLLYSVTHSRPNLVMRTYAVYSVALDPGGGPAGQPVELLRERFDQRRLPRHLALLTAPTGSMLAYLNARHELWAFSFDGSVEQRVAEHVQRLWAP